MSPDCTWAELQSDLDRVCDGRLLLSLILGPECWGLRDRVRECLELTGRTRHVRDSHLYGYVGDRPGWIACRIASIVVAVEILRLFENRPPAIDIARWAIEGHPASEDLMHKGRALARITGRSSRQN